MVIALLALLICACMFAIYAIVRTEERHLLARHKNEMPSSVQDSPRSDSGNTGQIISLGAELCSNAPQSPINLGKAGMPFHISTGFSAIPWKALNISQLRGICDADHNFFNRAIFGRELSSNFKLVQKPKAPGKLSLQEEEDQLQSDGLFPPFTANLKAEVHLTSPTEEPADIQENVTNASVVDIERYLRWADKLLKPNKTSDKAA